MTHFVLDTSVSHGRDEVASLAERLDALAQEIERAGLPWAAAGIRNVAGMIEAERQLIDRMAA